MKTIDDLLNLLKNSSVEENIELPEELKEYLKHNCSTSIERMKEYQYLYMQCMHRLQIEVQKIYGISTKRKGEIEKL